MMALDNTIKQRIDTLDQRLNAIHARYYSSHPPIEQLAPIMRLKLITIGNVAVVDWGTIRYMMDDNIATDDYDSILLIARKGIANLRFLSSSKCPEGSWWSCVFQNIGSHTLKERLRVVEEWLNRIEPAVMPGLMARAGAAMDKVRGYFYRGH